MELVATRPGDGVDNGAGGAPICRGVVGSHDRELLDGVYAQASPEHAARRAVRVIIYVDAINPVGVLIGTVAAVGKLVAKTTVSTIGGCPGRSLRTDADNARLEGRQLRPITPVQGKLYDRPLLDGCGNRRACCVHRGWSFIYSDCLSELPDLQTEIQCLLSSDSERDPLLHRGLETVSRHGYLVVARGKVWRGIYSVRVRGDFADVPGRNVFDGNFRTRHRATRLVGNNSRQTCPCQLCLGWLCKDKKGK